MDCKWRNLPCCICKWASVSPDKQLIPAEVVEESLQPWLRYLGLRPADYGCLLLGVAFNATADPSFPDGRIWCGAGLMGQMMCLNYETNRVAVLQRSTTVWDISNWINLIIQLQLYLECYRKSYNRRRTTKFQCIVTFRVGSCVNGRVLLTCVLAVDVSKAADRVSITDVYE